MQSRSPSLTEQESVTRDLALWEMERDWQSSQKKRTEVEWLVVFPEAKKRWGRIIRLGCKVQEMRLKNLLPVAKQAIQRDMERHYARPANDGFWPPKVMADGFDTIEWIKEAGRHWMEEIERGIRKTKSDRKLLSEIGNIKKKEREARVVITEEMIERARQYPLEKLIEINRQKFTKCFKHDDKTPSAYCKNNFIHCFVCQKTWDTIAVLVERDGIGFREAVLKLQ